jgi:hypothetical protein
VEPVLGNPHDDRRQLGDLTTRRLAGIDAFALDELARA